MEKVVTHYNNCRFILTLFFAIPAAIVAQAQGAEEKKATVILNNIKLEEALTIISISYEVQFSYSDSFIPTQRLVNLNLHDETLVTTLKKVLTPLGISYRIIDARRIVLQKSTVALTQIIRGTITDATTHSSIPGANVVIKDLSPLLGTSTNEKGEFKIQAVPVGRVSIFVSSIGYDSKTIEGLLIGTGKELVVDISLSEAVTNISEVVVSAPRSENTPGDGLVLTSGHSFSIEEAKRFAGSLGDPARMANAYAGVTGGSDDSNALVVRGNSPRGVLWRIDGIELPNPNHFTTEGASGGVISILSPNVIASTDFLSGAFPVQYGNALSAVFDISLRNGNNEKREYSLQAGLTGLEACVEGPFAKNNSASYLVNYRYSTLSVLDNLGFRLGDAAQYKNYQDLAFKINLPARRWGSFSIFGIGGKSQSNQADTTLSNNHASDMGIVGLNYKSMINSKAFVQASLSLSGTHILNFKKVNEISTNSLFVQENYSKSYLKSAITLRRKITSRYFTEAGVILSKLDHNFYLKTVDPQNSAYPLIVNFSETNAHSSMIMQAFIQSKQYFTPTLYSYYGFHFMRFSLTSDYSIEPRAGLRWLMSSKNVVSIAYGKHSRIENLQYYLARDHQTGGNEIQVNKNLGFTRAHHLVTSFNHSFTPLHQLKIEAYYQRIYNSPVQIDPNAVYATINEDTGFVSDSLINNGKGKNYGIELSFNRTFSKNLYYQVNGSLFQSQFKLGNGAERPTAYNGNYAFHLLGGKEFEVKHKQNRIGINLKITQAGGRPYVPIDLTKSINEKGEVYNWTEAFQRKLPGYFRTDFQLLYRVNRTRYSYEWRLDIQNVTNHRNASRYYYDLRTQTIMLKKQAGIIPILCYRIDF